MEEKHVYQVGDGNTEIVDPTSFAAKLREFSWDLEALMQQVQDIRVEDRRRSKADLDQKRRELRRRGGKW